MRKSLVFKFIEIVWCVIRRQSHSSENTTHGLIYYFIYEYDESKQKYIETGTLYYNHTTDFYSENEKYAEWEEDWDFRAPTVVEFEELPEHWKRAISFPNFLSSEVL